MGVSSWGGQKKGLQIPSCKAIIIANVLEERGGWSSSGLRELSLVDGIAVLCEWGHCSRSSVGREIERGACQDAH